MKSYIKNGRLFIELEEYMGSENSAQIRQEIGQILDQHPGLPLTLDAEQLRYISSSGLRVLMELIKDATRDLTVQNVCTEVYEIFMTTGFTTIMHIERKMRSIDIEGCPVIGQGASGTVYRLDGDTVVKVYRGGEDSLPFIRDETEKARQAFISGVPTAIPFDIVKVGDQYGSVFEMIDAQNCNDLVADDPAVLDTLLPAYAAFLKTLHGFEITHTELPAARDIFLENLAAYAACLDEDTHMRLRHLLEMMPEDRHLIHGDIQLKNVMMASGEVMLIDMDKFCVGNPAFEFASLFATYVAFNEDDPDNTLRFVGIDRENAFRIYHETLLMYLDKPEGTVSEDVERKVRILGCLRFLTILAIEMKDVHSPLKDMQIRHTAEKLKSLSLQVDSLTI